MYPAANPAPKAANAPAATAKANVSTEYAAGGGSAAKTSGPAINKCQVQFTDIKLGNSLQSNLTVRFAHNTHNWMYIILNSILHTQLN